MRGAHLVALMAIVSCTDGGPRFTTVRGVVSLSDVWGLARPNDGVTVRVRSTQLAAETAPDGRWEIASVPSGRRELEFAKEGYGLMRLPSVYVDGASLTIGDTTYLAETATHSAVIDSFAITTQYVDSALVIWGHITQNPPVDALARVVILYEGTSADVAPAKGAHAFTHVSISPQLTNGVTGEIIPPSASFITLAFLDHIRIRHGASVRTLYFVPYGYSAACSCYRDPQTQEQLYTNHGPRGSVVSVQIP